MQILIQRSPVMHLLWADQVLYGVRNVKNVERLSLVEIVI